MTPTKWTSCAVEGLLPLHRIVAKEGISTTDAAISEVSRGTDTPVRRF
ncbi:MAG: hypothetical protein WBW31_22680 [Candidatus Sulfotelmatobacter sp.]